MAAVVSIIIVVMALVPICIMETSPKSKLVVYKVLLHCNSHLKQL